MNLKEIGTLNDNPQYKLINGDYHDSYIAKFTLDGNDIEVFLSNNPLSVLPQIDSIYNTNYKEEYINSYSEDFIDNLPPKFQKVGSIDFRVNNKSDIPKIRQQNNINPNIEYNQLVQDNQNIINQATRYGFRNVNDALRSENNNPLLYKLVIQNRRLFQKLNDLSRQISNYKELPKEEPNIKFYIQALNQSVSIARDFFNKTKPNIIIVNFPSELPDEITQKRNNIYRQYIEKYLSQDYNIKEKNNILYLEKQGLQEMNEIKRMQKLAGILTEIVINNPTIKKFDIIDNHNALFIKIRIKDEYGGKYQEELFFGYDFYKDNKISFIINKDTDIDDISLLKKVIKNNKIPFQTSKDKDLEEKYITIDNKYFEDLRNKI